MADYTESLAGIWRTLQGIDQCLKQIMERNVLLIPPGGLEGQALAKKGDGIDWANFVPGDGSIPEPPPTTFTAYWGWRADNVLPTEEEIEAFQESGIFPHGQKVIADFSGAAGVPMFLFLAQPKTQPVKVLWYVDALNNDLISDTGTWRRLANVGDYDVYGTGFETDFTSPIDFTP